MSTVFSQLQLRYLMSTCFTASPRSMSLDDASFHQLTLHEHTIIFLTSGLRIYVYCMLYICLSVHETSVPNGIKQSWYKSLLDLCVESYEMGRAKVRVYRLASQCRGVIDYYYVCMVGERNWTGRFVPVK